LTRDSKILPNFKIWLGKDTGHVLGEGGATLLKAIGKHGSISEAARRTGMSYKYAWDQLERMEKTVGKPILNRIRGGRNGGGTELTETAVKLLMEYDRMRSFIGHILEDREYSEMMSAKLNARNRIEGRVNSIDKDKVTSRIKIKIKIKTPATITALMTKKAANELGIKAGDKVEAVIRSTKLLVTKN
jgi:molybdate transport system regulatory protein